MKRKVIALAGTIVLLEAQLSTAVAAPQQVGSAAGLNQLAVFAGENKMRGTFPGLKETFPIDTSKGSEALVKQLTTLSETEQNPQTIERVNKLEKEGKDLYDKAQTTQALTKWQDMYGLCLEMKYTEGQGRALTNMAKVFIDQAQWVKAKQLGENALELLSSGGSQSSLAQCRVVLAQAYFGLDNPVWAVQQLDAALRSLSNGQLNNPEEGSRIMYLCANLCLKFNKPKEAIRYFQEGAQYSFQRGDYAKAVQVRTAIVSTMIELGWLVASLEEANKLLSVAKAAPKDSLAYQASAYQALANAQFAANEFANARKSYEQVYAILPKLDVRAIPEVTRANIDEGYGAVLLASGDIEQARQLMLKSVAVFKAKAENFNLAQTYNSLGVIEVLDGQPGKAISYFQQAADYHVVLNPKAPRLHGVTLQNLGCAEFRSGSFRDAKNRFDGALAQIKPLKDQLLTGRLNQGLAEVSFKASDITAAETYVNKAIEISSKINDDGCLWRAYTLLGKIRLSRGEVEPGKEALTSALSYFRSPQAGDFPSADNLNFPVSRDDMGYMLVQLMASQGMTEQALITAEQIKEENFITEWMRRGGQVKSADRDVYTELVTQRARIHSAELISTPDKLIKEWQSWMERFKGVVQSNRSLARLIAPLPTKVSDIVEVANKYNAVAVEYLVGPDSSLVFTIEPSGRVSSSQLNVDRAKLKSQVTALLTNAGAAQTNPEADRVNLKALYSELLPQSVRRFLPTSAEQMIVIVPDGPLYNLPFAALIDEAGKFFVENHLLTMTSSMSVLMDSQPRISQDLSLLLTTSNGNNSLEQAETSQITSVVGAERVTALVGKDAAINQLEEQARGKSVVHIAARMNLIESNPLRSVLPILGDQNGESATKKVTAGTLCGTNMPSDLIVWSGSTVSNKDVRGNAVKIFSRGLNYAGARNVLMSLWAQPESDRMDELVNFYKSKQSGLGPAQSLRKAQLSALSRDRSPRNWAAFQLLGPGN